MTVHAADSRSDTQVDDGAAPVRASGVGLRTPARTQGERTMPADATAREPMRPLGEPLSDAVTAPRVRLAFPPPARGVMAAGHASGAASVDVPSPSPPPVVRVPALVVHARSVAPGEPPEARRTSPPIERAPSLSLHAAKRLGDVASPRADDRWHDASDTVFAHAARALVTRVRAGREPPRLPRWLDAIVARHLDAVLVALTALLLLAALWLLVQLP